MKTTRLWTSSGWTIAKRSAHSWWWLLESEFRSMAQGGRYQLTGTLDLIQRVVRDMRGEQRRTDLRIAIAAFIPGSDQAVYNARMSEADVVNGRDGQATDSERTSHCGTR